MTSILAHNDDTFLVSYPRSGNTWMRYLLANLLKPGNRWHIKNINEVVPDIYQVDISSHPRPRIIKSHEPYSGNYPKVIYMYRDGRDVAVSYYDLSRTAFGYTGSFNDFVLQMLRGGKDVGFGSWQDHVTGWLGAARNGNVLCVQYEALCGNTVEILGEIGRFIGKSFDPELISTAISNSTFNVQKEHVKMYSEHYKSGFRGGVKGGPGKWREVFSEELNELFWFHAGILMTSLGYRKS